MPIYLISGDTPLLVQTCQNQLRQMGKQHHFIQRKRITFDSNDAWDAFQNQTNNLNLFSEKCYLEINNPKAKFDKLGTKILAEYLSHPSPDIIIVMITSKLTANQKKTNWYKAIDKHGAIINIRPIALKDLPEWIANRTKQAKLNVNRESCHLLAILGEGNLTAIHHAIEKLRLLYSNEHITPNHITRVIHDSAEFSVFDLSNYTLTGKSTNTLRCLHALQSSGTEPTLVLWTFSRDCRELIHIHESLNRGIPRAQLLQKQWQSRRNLLNSALSRLSLKQCHKLHQFITYIDLVNKGIRKGNVWQLLETLSLQFCGIPIKEGVIHDVEI